MVLELEIPEDYSFKALRPMLPKFLTYILSFIYLGIYWNNHHHLFQADKQVSGNILWANLNLLFWLSLLPFATGWMGENHFKANPTAMYGAVLLMAAWAFKVLVYCVVKDEGKESRLGKVYSRDKKLDISLLLYLIGIVLSFFQPIISLAIYLIVALIWIVPDPRIERNLKE